MSRERCFSPRWTGSSGVRKRRGRWWESPFRVSYRDYVGSSARRKRVAVARRIKRAYLGISILPVRPYRLHGVRSAWSSNGVTCSAASPRFARARAGAHLRCRHLDELRTRAATVVLARSAEASIPPSTGAKPSTNGGDPGHSALCETGCSTPTASTRRLRAPNVEHGFEQCSSSRSRRCP